jgi:glycosyltransferase involved in cell wall biosynthesis
MIEMLGRGGLIHYAYQLCQALQKAGVETTLITATDYELVNLPHPFEIRPILRLWDPRKPKPDTSLLRLVRRLWRGFLHLRAWYGLVRLLRKERPDVVLFSEMRFALDAHFLRYLKRQGLVLADIVHDVRAYETSNTNKENIVKDDLQHRAAYQELYSLFEALFVHDASNRQIFLNLYPTLDPRRVHQIIHATSELMLQLPQAYTPEGLRAHLKIPSGVPIVLFFGTVTKYKGLDDLIDAFPLVHQNTGAHLLVAGYPAKDVAVRLLHASIESLKLEQASTLFLDYVPNEWVATLMSLASVVVLPYRAISQSGVLQVAYACGRPVVATRVGGLPDAVLDGETGVLVEPHQPLALAEALINLLLEPEKLTRMGLAARRLAQERYSWATVAEAMKSVFAALPRNETPLDHRGQGGRVIPRDDISRA